MTPFQSYIGIAVFVLMFGLNAAGLFFVHRALVHLESHQRYLVGILVKNGWALDVRRKDPPVV